MTIKRVYKYCILGKWSREKIHWERDKNNIKIDNAKN